MERICEAKECQSMVWLAEIGPALDLLLAGLIVHRKPFLWAKTQDDKYSDIPKSIIERKMEQKSKHAQGD